MTKQVRQPEFADFSRFQYGSVFNKWPLAAHHIVFRSDQDGLWVKDRDTIKQHSTVQEVEEFLHEWGQKHLGGTEFYTEVQDGYDGDAEAIINIEGWRLAEEWEIKFLQELKEYQNNSAERNKAEKIAEARRVLKEAGEL